MKRILFFTIIIWSLNGFSQSNIYHSFPSANAVWNFNFSTNCFGRGAANENYSITISGDTILNNKVYQKLFVPYVQSNSSANCGGFSTGYKGAIREDVTLKKVYFMAPFDTTEQLLYDFNMQVGDTVKGYLHNVFSEVVLAIDTVLVGNTHRKIWLINNCYNISIIEGIGSTYGLIEKSPACMTDLPDFSLHCFQSSSQQKYPANAIGCQIITNTDELSAKVNFIEVYPNPSSGRIKINTDFNIQKIEVYNFKGQLVKNLNNQSNQFELPTPKGVYLIQLIGEDGSRYSEKVLKH